MRGAPHVGFSRLMRRIHSRVSVATVGLPLLPERTFHVQNTRYSFLCQPMTVSGTITSHYRQSEYSREIQIQNRRSTVLSCGLFGAVRRNTKS